MVMDDKNKGNGMGDFDLPRSWMKKKEEDSKVRGISYFFAFILWIPILVTVVKFWWDFFSWLFV